MGFVTVLHAGQLKEAVSTIALTPPIQLPLLQSQNHMQGFNYWWCHH